MRASITLPAVALILLLLLCAGTAFAGTTAIKTTLPPKYNIIKTKIDTGTGGLVYEMQNPNIVYVTYRITDYNPALFWYTIRLYSNHHADIIDEINLSTQYGTVQLKTHDYQPGTYWLNLQRWAIDEETYCAQVGLPCEIGKNLDIIRMDYPDTNPTGDEYQTFIDGAIKRSGQPVKGAAWTNK